jgi:hypothetical protein
MLVCFTKREKDMDYDLIIAGTSCGGSSYAHRVLKLMREKQYDKYSKLKILITKGDKQDAVGRSVISGIDDINVSMSRAAGKDISVHYDLHKEN